MERSTVVLLTLLAYNLLLVGIGFFARGRTRDTEDFFLGGRRLGPLVAAISYSASASSAWTLLGVSGAAFVLGLPVVWVAAGSCSGMLLAWFWVGPRLMERSRREGSLTFTAFLVHGLSGAGRRNVVWTASVIIVLSFSFYVAAQFQGAGNAFARTFDLPMDLAVWLGAGIILLYTLLGGFWAVSLTDVVQGLLMSAAAVLLPVAAIAAVGGWPGFMAGLHAVSTPEQLQFDGGAAGLLLIGMVLGGLGIGLGTFGQPHLMVRFMALRDARALRTARLLTMVWYAIVFLGMCLAGLAGHVLLASLPNPENVFFALSEQLFSPLLNALLVAAVLSAIMSTADSQLLVAASAVAHDLRPSGWTHPMRASRLAVAGLVLLAVLIALYLPERIFSRVLFAWSALGAAFGPLLFWRLCGAAFTSRGALCSMLSGFGLSLVLYLAPDAPGDVAERIAPFMLSLAVLFALRPRSAKMIAHE